MEEGRQEGRLEGRAEVVKQLMTAVCVGRGLEGQITDADPEQMETWLRRLADGEPLESVLRKGGP